MQRLDLQCATTAAGLGERFTKTEEKLIADCSAVLAGQGLYAFAVFLRARPKKDKEAGVLLVRCGKLISFLGPQTSSPAPPTEEAVVALVQSIAADLHKLLLAKKMVAETLTYLKYHVKSKDDPNKAKPSPTPATQPKAAEQPKAKVTSG